MAIHQGKRPSPRAQGELRRASVPTTKKPIAEKSVPRRVHVRLDEAMFKRIDDFRFKNRFNRRTEAARWLLQWALKNLPKEELKNLPKKKKRSEPKMPKKAGGR